MAPARIGSASRTALPRGSNWKATRSWTPGTRAAGSSGSPPCNSPKEATIETFPLPDRQDPPEIAGTSARFVQTCGGRTGLPAPRRVNHPPFVQFTPPIAWTSLALTIHSDGTSEFEVVGASKFPRHWIYDTNGDLAAKVGLTDFKEWWRNAFGKHTPWGDEESPAYMAPRSRLRWNASCRSRS